jgi:outer membrane protein assembly factor BamB
MAGGCGGNEPVTEQPPGPACDAAWHDFQHGTELDDQLWGLAIDAVNNVYLTGYEHGLAYVTNIEPAGDSHGVVLKLDPSGAVQWSTTIDTDATDSIEDVAVEPGSGRIFAVGRTSGSFPGFTIQDPDQFDEVLLALDPGGRVERLVQQGDGLPRHPARLGLGVDHDLVVAGYNDTFVQNNAVEGWEDGFVQRFDLQSPPAAGVAFHESFFQTVPVNLVNRITGVAVERDGSGSMYVTGYITGGPSVGPYVKKLARDGTQIWNTVISRFSVDVATAVGLSPAGELFVTGATFAKLGLRSFGQQDAFVLKLDKDTGETVWATQAGSTESEESIGLGFDADHHIYIAGITTGSMIDGAPSHGGIDVFAMKFDPNGALLATWQGGSAADDLMTTMAVDHCGHVLIGGFSQGAVAADAPAPAGGDDMFVVRARFP